MITTTGTSGRDATLSANLGEHQRHVPRAVAMQMAPIVVPRMNSHQQKCSDTTIEKYIRKSSRLPSTATMTKRLLASSFPGQTHCSSVLASVLQAASANDK